MTTRLPPQIIDRWLSTKIDFEDNYTIKDVTDLLNDKVWNWIHSQEDLFVNQDYESFKIDFINFIYSKYR